MADYEAVKVPLDPTPAQERMFRMYATTSATHPPTSSKACPANAKAAR